MRSFLLLLIVSVLVSSGGKSQVNKKWADFKLLNCEPVIQDYLWSARTELTNLQYLEFVTYIKNKISKDSSISLLPDTTKWTDKIAYAEPYVEYYFRHPAYQQYPVTCISYEQATAYCNWLTEILNKRYQADAKHPVQELIVRLPSEKEWIIAAQAGNKNAMYPWKWNTLRNQDKKFQGMFMANFVRGKADYMGIAGSLNDNADITAPAKSYWPNEFGLYCMSGNVAEMLLERGRTKGGSWGSRAHSIEIFAKDEFEGWSEPNSRIGFRYFIEVVELKDFAKQKRLKLTAKRIEKLFEEVEEGKLLAGKYEVSNRLYKQFVGETGQLEHASINSKWAREVPHSAQYVRNYGTHSKYWNHPVVNIGKNSAVAFCDWLTKKYLSYKKRKYQNIEFRLPSEIEWEKAARGNIKNSAYPWGGPYARNSRGCHLCNYNPVQERWIVEKGDQYLIDGLTDEEIREAGKLDGLMITGEVDSYHPNGFGLYNMAGNVAEMLNEGRITKGGSWGSFIDKVQINSSEPMTAPNPYTGFRVFAEIKN